MARQIEAFRRVLLFRPWLDSSWNATAASCPGECCWVARQPSWCLADAGCACVAEMAVTSRVAFLPAALPSGRAGHMQRCAPRHCWRHAALLTAAATTHASVYVFSDCTMMHSSICASLQARPKILVRCCLEKKHTAERHHEGDTSEGCARFRHVFVVCCVNAVGTVEVSI